MNREELLVVSSSPHIYGAGNTRRVMLDVLLALLPACVMSILLFGWQAALLLAVCTAVAVLTEWVFDTITHRPNTVGDLSAAVTGVLLALNLPATLPLWQAVIGAVFAIAVVKCLFGGLGQNFANPAITARIMLLISFTSSMTAVPAVRLVDTVASATPLALQGTADAPTVTQLFLGLHSGAMGETCALALLIGGAYLLVRRVISWHTPVIFIATVFVLSWIATGELQGGLYQILSGGLILGAFFMATDYATTPTTKPGRAIFGLGCGLITVLIRQFGGYPEGVSFAILLMNILTPYIDKWTMYKPLGGTAK